MEEKENSQYVVPYTSHEGGGVITAVASFLGNVWVDLFYTEGASNISCIAF